MGRRRAVLVATLVAAAACAKESDGEKAVQGPGFRDHWHTAFGVYVCGEFERDLPENESPAGIHTHGDGVIHIHPFVREGAGANATLETFLEHASLDLDEVGSDECDGVLQIAHWNDLDGEPTVVEDPADVHFTGDEQAVTVAFVTEGDEIPQPPSTDDLAELGAVDQRESPTTTADRSTTPPPPVDPAGDIEDGFYPVLSAAPLDRGCVAGSGTVPGHDGEECFVVDLDSALSTDIVESATVERPQGLEQISLVLTEDGIDAFNELAAACYNATDQATCPTSRIAIVVDGEVISAPTIAEPSFERDEILISGADDLDLGPIAEALDN